MICNVSLYSTYPVYSGSEQLASCVHPPSSDYLAISGLKPLR